VLGPHWGHSWRDFGGLGEVCLRDAVDPVSGWCCSVRAALMEGPTLLCRVTDQCSRRFDPRDPPGGSEDLLIRRVRRFGFDKSSAGWMWMVRARLTRWLCLDSILRSTEDVVAGSG